jgi:hypothetical protein
VFLLLVDYVLLLFRRENTSLGDMDTSLVVDGAAYAHAVVVGKRTGLLLLQTLFVIPRLLWQLHQPATHRRQCLEGGSGLDFS